MQAASTAAERKAIAKQERERLKLQEKQKKENLEKLRVQQQTEASADDVRYFLITPTCLFANLKSASEVWSYAYNDLADLGWPDETNVLAFIASYYKVGWLS